jgi:hypothetical protein
MSHSSCKRSDSDRRQIRFWPENEKKDKKKKGMLEFLSHLRTAEV